MNRALTLTMGLAVTVALVSCGTGNPTSPGYSPKPAYEEPSQVPLSIGERLIGTWNAKDGRSSIAFRKGGSVDVTFTRNGASVKVSGAYTVSGHTLTLVADAMEKDKDTSLFTAYTCAIEAEMLILTTSDGKVTAWVRMPPPVMVNS